VANAKPRPHYPGKDPVPIVQEAGWAPGLVWTGAENLAPTRIRARSESLYRLSHPGPHFYMYVLCMCIQRVLALMEHSHWQAQCLEAEHTGALMVVH
jgi:hypothetical protein